MRAVKSRRDYSTSGIFYNHNFLTKYASAYAPAKMENIIAQEPAANVAPPVSAWPEVQPRAIRAPYRKIVPPRNAISQRVRLETLGPLVVSILVLPKRDPEVKPPNSAPKNTGTIQSLSGFLSPPAILSRY